MEGLKWANLALTFLLELAALAALGYWGYTVGEGTLAKLGLAIGLPLVTAVVWGLFLAPKAVYKVPGWLRFLLKTVVFGLAALALVATGHPWLGIAFALIVIANAALNRRWQSGER